MRPVLIIYAKAPLMGKAKTRLAADIGKVQAQRAYRSMCAKIFRVSTSPAWDTYIYVTPDGCADKTFGGLWPKHLPRIAQGPGGLTARSAKIFTYKGPMINIGTDTPALRRADIASGFKALKTHSAVFGPATDGGFWLIGLNGPARPGLFDNVRWSHRDTLKDMQARIDGRVARLRTLTDIDDGAALDLYRGGLSRSRQVR